METNPYALKRRVEIAPGAHVHVPVQTWGELLSAKDEEGSSAAVTPPQKGETEEEANARMAAELADARVAWLEKKIEKLAKVCQRDDAETKSSTGDLAFRDSDDLRSKLSGGQVTYLLRVMGGDDALPASFLDWHEAREGAAGDAGPDGGEVRVPAE